MMAIAKAFEVKTSAKITDEDLNGHIIKLKTKSKSVFAIADSGIPMSFLNETTIRRLQLNDSSTIVKHIPREDTARNLACFNEKWIVTKRRIIIAIKSAGWTIQSASFFVVDDQQANRVGRNLLPQIGIKLIQEKPQNYQILNISERENQI